MTFRFPVTIVLIIINAIVFAIIAAMQKSIMMDKSEDIIALVHAGANLNPFIIGGEYWRLLTSNFLHIGIVHLVVNMMALWSLGGDLEPELGSLKFILLYVICGISANISGLFFNVYVISAGASGAIFGLYGYWLASEIISGFREQKSLGGIIVSFAIFMVVQYVMAGLMPLDTAGHIGGAMAGALIAIVRMKFHFLKSSVHLLLLLMLLPLLVFIVPRAQYSYYNIYQAVMAEEEKVDYYLKSIRNNNALADSLDRSQAQWDSLRIAVTNIPGVPPKLISDTTVMSRYIGVRLQELKYKVKLINESYIYLDSLETIATRFDSIGQFKYYLMYQRPPAEVEKDSVAKREPALPLTKVYYDKDWRETKFITDAKYYRIGSRDSIGRWQGAVRDYYLTGKIQMKGSYKDDLRDGVFIYYTDRDAYSSAGVCSGEFAVGKWEEFHWNGKIEREVQHDPEYYVKTIWDSLDNAMVLNGNGTYKRWYSNGMLAEEGEYRNGKQEGYWYGYHPNGEPYYKEMFRDNRLISGASRQLNGKQFVYDGLSEYPVPVNGLPKFQEYARQVTRSQQMGNNCSGIVRVLFTVGDDGSLWDFTILRGLSHECNRTAISIIKNGPAWRPAVRHGNEKVQQQTYIDISF